jgi:hypothetical protein
LIKISRKTLERMAKLNKKELMMGFTNDGTHFKATGDGEHINIVLGESTISYKMTPTEKEEYADIVVHAADAPKEVKETYWFKSHMRKLFDFDPELKP